MTPRRDPDDTQPMPILDPATVPHLITLASEIKVMGVSLAKLSADVAELRPMLLGQSGEDERRRVAERELNAAHAKIRALDERCDRMERRWWQITGGAVVVGGLWQVFLALKDYLR